MALRARVRALQKRPQPQQRTPEWYKARQTMITASEAASCLYKSEAHCKAYVDHFKLLNFKYKDMDPLNPYENKQDYIIKKCSLYYDEYTYKDTVHTLWGKKFEDAASRLYCQLYSTNLLEFGLVPHGRLKWLAASPDGITSDGVMLEIKCPKSRKIDRSCIPLYYWVQVQIQLEVCNLENCDFIECELREFPSKADFITSECEHRGVTIQLPNTDNDPKFVYPPPTISSTFEYLRWTDETLQKLGQDAKVTYYVILSHCVQRIPRSREWFNNVKGDIKSTFDIIQKLQGNREDFLKYKQSIHELKSKKYMDKYHQTECMINDNDSTFVMDIEPEKDTGQTVCLID
ncbi:hypothetical protein EB118_15585 [bacterium]|nr:hypothetical protein [bacterium]NDD83760.1 hypothetical protein [bacterium]NDG31476.1 hypothetical protein [bacterium]